MSSLFNQKYREELLHRIKSLSPENESLWGVMNAAQMLAHCNMAFKTAFGEEKSKRALVGILFGTFAKKQIHSHKPFAKGLPTGGNFRIQDDKDFEAEKGKLIENVLKFADGGGNVLTSDPHPFFGKMNVLDWDRLMCKHLDHNLRQFGV